MTARAQAAGLIRAAAVQISGCRTIAVNMSNIARFLRKVFGDGQAIKIAEGSRMTPAIDLSHRFLNPLGDGKYRFTFIDRAAVEKVTGCFVEGRMCLIRHCGRVFIAQEITDAFGGRYNLTVIETKLELVPAAPPTER